MNAKELAEQLNGETYPLAIPKILAQQAKDSGLVIVFGASDDLMEFRGSIHDELGCYKGGTARVDAAGLLPDFESIDGHEKDILRDYFKREPNAVEIEALWCAEPSYTWTYKTSIPHETFEVIKDGEPYCRGIVFSIDSIPKLTVA